MKLIKKIFRVLINPKRLIQALDNRAFFYWMPDKMFLKMIFWARVGYRLDLKNPQTFNEKLQWLKLYNRRPEYTIMVDKYAVKKYVADRIGEEYVIPSLGVWDKPEDIDFATLPNQFVLKCTHDSAGLVICKDKSKLDISAVKDTLRRAFKRNFYYYGREWVYKDVPKKIIAERYMEDNFTRELRDYKFFAFDGVVKALFVATERQDLTTDTKFDFFDMKYQHLDLRQGHPNAKIPPKKPEKFEEMCRLAEILSKGIPHVRVDFYEANGKVYFGELTFFHYSGIVPFDPPQWDKIFGDWLRIPNKYENGTR